MLFGKKSISDQVIIEGIKAGGTQRRQHENLLYEKYFYFIREGTKKHRLGEEECSSAYSDAVLLVIDHLLSNRFEGRSELKTYLFQIFSNKCVDQIRKNTTNQSSVNNGIPIEDLLHPLPDDTRTIVQQLMIDNDIDLLRERLKAIGEKCNEMAMAWGEGYSDAEIAKMMNYNSPSVAKTSRLRCMERLKEMYQKDFKI